MVEIKPSNNVTRANAHSKGAQVVVKIDNNPLQAFFLGAQDSAAKAAHSASLASSKLDEINTAADNIYASLDATKQEILNSIISQQDDTINAVNQSGAIQIQAATDKVNEILDLNPANANLSNLSEDGIEVIKQAAFEKLSEPLSNKLEKCDVKAFIKETYINGVSGYRIWSDGYCEQWGRIYPTNNDIKLTFLKKWANTDYYFNKQYSGSFTGEWRGSYHRIYNITTTSITTYSGVAGDLNLWKATGYLAEGEY